MNQEIEIGDRVKFGYQGDVYFGRVIKINRKTYKIEDEKTGDGLIFVVDKELCILCLKG